MFDENKVVEFLENKYKGTKFYFIINEYLVELLYDNTDYKNDDDFCGQIFEECSRFLSEDDLCKLAVAYDFISRIPKQPLEYSVKLENREYINDVPMYKKFDFDKLNKKSIIVSDIIDNVKVAFLKIVTSEYTRPIRKDIEINNENNIKMNFNNMLKLSI